MNGNEDYLGRGWAFPPTFNKQSREAVLVKGVEDINQSLGILLATSLGERIMQPEFGCNLSDFQFEPINSAFVAFVKDLVRTAILYYEPRIRADRVEVTESTDPGVNEGLFLIKVSYTVRNTNSRFNFVFPFFRNEAVQNILDITQQL